MEKFFATESQVMVEKPYANFRLIRRHQAADTFKSLRAWCQMWPDAWNLQIRIPNGKQIKLVTVDVTIEEMEELLAFMKSYANKSG